MTMKPSPMESRQEADAPFGLKDILIVIRFVINAILRHKLIVVITVVVVVAMTVGLLKILPRTYVVTSRIMTKSTEAISMWTTSSQGGRDSASAFGVDEVMKSRENLLAIVDEANLIDLYLKQRPEISKLKAKVFSFIFGEPTREELRDSLVYTLDSRLWVKTEVQRQGNIIDLGVEWRHPQTALKLQKILLNRFFEERRNIEMGEIKETIRLLKAQYAEAEAELKRIEEENKAILEKTVPAEDDAPAPEVSAKVKVITPKNDAPSVPAVSAKELGMVTAELQATQSEIDRLRSEHTRRLNTEKENLAQIATTYGPQHPDLIKSQRYVELLSKQDPVPARLLSKEQSLRTLLESMERRAAVSGGGSSRVRRVIPRQAALRAGKGEELDRVAMERLISEELTTREYQKAETALFTIGQRLQNAQMNLKATEAAFAYRYRVTQPPLFPKRPSKPKKLRVMLGGIALSLFLGFFFAVFVDIRSGLIIESWQVEKLVNVPLLGEIDESE